MSVLIGLGEPSSIFHLRQVIKLGWLVGLKLLKFCLVNTGHTAATRANRDHGLLVLQPLNALVARLIMQGSLQALSGGPMSHVLLVHATLWLEIGGCGPTNLKW